MVARLEAGDITDDDYEVLLQLDRYAPLPFLFFLCCFVFAGLYFWFFFIVAFWGPQMNVRYVWSFRSLK